MSINSSRSQLKAAMSHLLQQWDEVTTHWDDPASRAFEKDFLAGLEPSLRATIAAMDTMSDLLRKIRRDCE